MVKKDLVNEISERTGLLKKDSELFLNAFVDSVAEGLENDAEVNVAGLGKFFAKESVARVGRNPFSGESIDIASKMRVSFKFSKGVKESL